MIATLAKGVLISRWGDMDESMPGVVTGVGPGPYPGWVVMHPTLALDGATTKLYLAQLIIRRRVLDDKSPVRHTIASFYFIFLPPPGRASPVLPRTHRARLHLAALELGSLGSW